MTGRTANAFSCLQHVFWGSPREGTPMTFRAFLLPAMRLAAGPVAAVAGEDFDRSRGASGLNIPAPTGRHRLADAAPSGLGGFLALLGLAPQA